MPQQNSDDACALHDWLMEMLRESRRWLAHLSGETTRTDELAWANQMPLLLEEWLGLSLAAPPFQTILSASEGKMLQEAILELRRPAARLLAWFYGPHALDCNVSNNDELKNALLAARSISEESLWLSKSPNPEERRKAKPPARYFRGPLKLVPADDDEFVAALDNGSWLKWQLAIGKLYSVVLALRKHRPDLDRPSESPTFAATWQAHCGAEHAVEKWALRMMQMDERGMFKGTDAGHSAEERLQEKYGTGVKITPTFLRRSIEHYLNGPVRDYRLMVEKDHPVLHAVNGFAERAEKSRASFLHTFCEQARPLNFADAPPFPTEITDATVVSYLEGLRGCCIRRIESESPQADCRLNRHQIAEMLKLSYARVCALAKNGTFGTEDANHAFDATAARSYRPTPSKKRDQRSPRAIAKRRLDAFRKESGI